MSFASTTFANRRDAGRQLAAHLEHMRDRDPLVIGLPRGGVVVAAEVANALDADLDIWHNRMIAKNTFVEMDEWTASSYRDAMHKLCIECHRERGVRDREGEIKGTRCPDCHPSGGVRESDLDG